MQPLQVSGSVPSTIRLLQRSLLYGDEEKDNGVVLSEQMNSPSSKLSPLLTTKTLYTQAYHSRCHRIRKYIATQMESIRLSLRFSAKSKSQMCRTSWKENSRPNNSR